ncbi:DNA-binding response regulator [Flexivirga endophytica]|uniref:DNA-binding response regulator n=1 Tax=Flexivirga endophytica TaxID=1849103 RepID=A0A916TC56_9MICO|nr:response regulator transcription factor [Flexivirga endophytica]GGB37765.1 DNA-binding response regulator [Flexivirga endophytica]GHB45284.1 DNA-binding response regulator [Flexivirga endophytica]
MADPRTRVALIDDLAVVRSGFAITHPGLDVIDTFADTETFLRNPPDVDVVLVDLKLATGAAAGVQQARPAIRSLAAAGHVVCIYTEETRDPVLALCLRAGAQGITHKYDPPTLTTQNVDRVAAGGFVISSSLVGVAELLQRHGKLPDITDKQRQVLRLRARGIGWSDIADQLYIGVAAAHDRMNAVNEKFARYLQSATPADIEREFGLGTGDLLDD